MIVARALAGPGFTIVDYFPSYYDCRLKLIARRLEFIDKEPKSYDQDYIRFIREITDELEDYVNG